MKKTITALLYVGLVALLVLLPVTTAQAKAIPTRKPQAVTLTTQNYSWFGNSGTLGYSQTTLYPAAFVYDFGSVGYYAPSGNAFVGQAQSVTEISGTCWNNRRDEGVSFFGYVSVDNLYSLPLFYTHESVGVFNLVAQGQSFVIVLQLASPSAVGCNIKLENKS